MKFVITNKLKQYNKHTHYKSKRVLRIFIDDKSRPKTIFEDFAWRRSVSYAALAHNPELRAFIADYLQLPDKDLSIQFSRYAGCSMCPCSPGLVVRWNEMNYRSDDPAIWIKISDERKS